MKSAVAYARRWWRASEGIRFVFALCVLVPAAVKLMEVIAR